MSRGHIPTDEVLKKLRTGREGAILTKTKAKIGSRPYVIADDVLNAIDRLAEELTGDPEFFHLKMAPAADQPKRR